MSDLILPIELRVELKKPIGELIRGTIEETTPVMIQKISRFRPVVAVGDITSDIIVNSHIKPDIIITDGKTKRENLNEWTIYPNFYTLHCTNPAGEISRNAWDTIIKAVNKLNDEEKIQILVDGEEDLLVLPLLIELQSGVIIYGAPNTGCVVVEVNEKSKNYARNIITRMKVKH